MGKKIVLGLSILVILGSILVISNKPINNLVEYDENTTLALFNKDGEKIDQVPSKDSGYTLDTEKSSCTNGSISWDKESWSPVITVNNEVNGRVSCTLYFKEATAYDECIMEYGSNSIQCGILAQLDTTGICPTVNKEGNVLIYNVEAINGYLCSTPDDYGTSYYYRGNVTNNYVKFGTNESGKDMYWRIIRINGNGSIRMIYDGTSAHENGESSKDREIDNIAYNPLSDDNAYVGYMYGTTGSSTYNATHANIHDSTIKTYLDEWYANNLLGSNEEQYLADTLFCNDRSFSSNNTGTGAGKSITFYRWQYYHTNTGVTLNCAQKNDCFTVNDEVNGNGDLMYPIGLITVDESFLAGGSDVENLGYYLYTGYAYWTISPSSFGGSVAMMRSITPNGNAFTINGPHLLLGVRPVINLKPNSLVSGDGTADNPYSVI